MTIEEKAECIKRYCLGDAESDNAGCPNCPLEGRITCWADTDFPEVIESNYDTLVKAGLISAPGDAVPKLDAITPSLDGGIPKPVLGHRPAENDMVNHPFHYVQGGIECIDALTAMITPYNDPNDAALSWQVVKYIWRHPFKSKPLEDLQKAEFYIKRLIKLYEEKERCLPDANT